MLLFHVCGNMVTGPVHIVIIFMILMKIMCKGGGMGKVIPVLSYIMKHYAMKACRGVEV